MKYIIKRELETGTINYLSRYFSLLGMNGREYTIRKQDAKRFDSKKEAEKNLDKNESVIKA